LSPGRLISEWLAYVEPTLGSRERAYLLSFLETDKKRLSQGLALGSLLVLTFIYSDYLFFGTSRQFWALLSLRVFFIGAAAGFIAFSNRLKSPEHFDWAALAVALVGVIVQLYIASSRPSSYTVISVEPLITISIYLLCPGNLIFRAFPAFLISIGTVLICLNFRTSMEVQRLILLLAMQLGANVLGIFVSALLNNSRRRQFLAQVTLQEAKSEVEAVNRYLEAEVLERKRAERTLRQSEERFKQLAELLPAFVYEFDETGRFTFVNRSGLELGGYTRDNLPAGVTVTEVVIPEDVERVANNISRVMGGERVWGEPYTLLRKDGATADIETWSSPIVRDDAIVGVRGVGIDVTERKAAEALINASLKEKEVLLREIHHRVKNNLAVISALLTLQAQFAPDYVRELFESVQDRIRAMAIAHEKMYQTENLSALNVDEYTKSIVDKLFGYHTGLAARVTLRTEIERISLGIDTAIPLGMIVTELVSNCLKHAYPEGTEGDVAVSVRVVGKQEYELVVSDKGVGMSDDGDRKDAKSFGLDLVSALVDQLDGQMEICGVNGTEVRIRFKEVKKSRGGPRREKAANSCG
jgi:PAS domain S-box-containing protein